MNMYHHRYYCHDSEKCYFYFQVKYSLKKFDTREPACVTVVLERRVPHHRIHKHTWTSRDVKKHNRLITP
jgi:hypothetical protein